MILGREGGQYGGSIKLVSRRPPSRWGWDWRLGTSTLLAGQKGFGWFCQNLHKDADIGSWKWLEDTGELRPEDQLHNQIHTHCADPVVQGEVRTEREALSMTPADSGTICQWLGTDLGVLTMAQTTLGNFLHFTFEEMEAQRGLVIRQGSHSWRTVEQGLKVRLWLKAVTLTTAPHSLVTRDT